MNNSIDKRNFFRKISEFLEKVYKPLTLVILTITGIVLYFQLTALIDSNRLKITQDIIANVNLLANQMDSEIWKYLYGKPEDDPKCTIDNIFPFAERPSASNPHSTCLLKQRYLYSVFNHYQLIYLQFREYIQPKKKYDKIDLTKKYVSTWEITLHEQMLSACYEISLSHKLQNMLTRFAPDYSSIKDMKEDLEDLIKIGCIPSS